MHLLIVIKIVGAVAVFLGVAMLVPAAVSAGYGEGDWNLLLLDGSLTAVFGVALLGGARRARDVSIRDSFVVVTAAWLTAALLGSTPYLLTGAIPTVPDALFESVSGFTTTGASVLARPDKLSHGLQLWRSMTEWFGGMGIIVLAVAVLPAVGVGGMRLIERELTGPIKQKFTARLRDTAIALWTIYVGLTVLLSVVLLGLGMSAFDAINHAMTTIATGGFSTHPNSVGGFRSPAIEWTLIVFMLIGAMNFTLHYTVLRHGKLGGYLRDVEWRWFLIGMLLCAAATSGYLFFTQGYAWSEALTKGTFQVVSIGTSSGFASADYASWGAFPQAILLMLMLIGGCAGSTSGGIKWMRLLLSFENLSISLLRLLHPSVVTGAKYGGSAVDDRMLSSVGAFGFLFVISLGAVTLLLTLDGYSLFTAIGAAASALGNVGPALAELGPTRTFAEVSPASKTVLMGAMLLGRLELMTIIVLFQPRAWQA